MDISEQRGDKMARLCFEFANTVVSILGGNLLWASYSRQYLT